MLLIRNIIYKQQEILSVNNDIASQCKKNPNQQNTASLRDEHQTTDFNTDICCFSAWFVTYSVQNQNVSCRPCELALQKYGSVSL